MSDRDALNEAIAGIRFESAFTRDDDTAGRMALLLEDIERLRDNPRRSRTVAVNLTNVPPKPQKRGWLQ